MQTPCPCGRSGTFGGVLPYDRCCGRYLDDPDADAPDAETLMRARYCAYATGRTDYLRRTWDPAHRPPELRPEPGVGWEGLQVLDHRPLGEDRSEVEFVARFRSPTGRAGRLHERSRFVRRSGRWFYVDGDVR